MFNLLGANITDRYELANIIAFQARRLRAEDTHVVARTTVVSDSTTDKLTLDEAHLLAVQFDHGLPAFPEPRVTLNQVQLDAIWRNSHTFQTLSIASSRGRECRFCKHSS